MKQNGSETEFTEVISVKKLIFRPFVKAYLKNSDPVLWKT